MPFDFPRPGLNPTAADIMFAAGDCALRLKKAFDDAVAINTMLQQHTDSELAALGDPMSANNITILKTAMADLAYMKVNAFDSSLFVKQIIGLGI